MWTLLVVCSVIATYGLQSADGFATSHGYETSRIFRPTATSELTRGASTEATSETTIWSTVEETQTSAELLTQSATSETTIWSTVEETQTSAELLTQSATSETTIGSTDVDYTCRHRCGYDFGYCSCASSCEYRGDCCPDYRDHCLHYTTENPTAIPTSNTPANTAPPSCRYNCGWNLGSCSCSSSCRYYGNCCNDYYDHCHYYTTENPTAISTSNTPATTAPPSCRYNCGRHLGSCSCSSSCRYYGNCCNDYHTYCYYYTTIWPSTAPPSCRYNCGRHLGSCSCSSSCQYYGNCCNDYYSYCYHPTTNPSTDTTSAIPCGGSLYGNGTFSSPNYPYHYPDHSYCIWNLRASNDQRILLTFKSLQLENCCSCDYIAVYDGSSVNSQYLGKVCQGNLTSFSSSSKYMTVLFRTDYSITARGFSAEFLSTLSPSSAPPSCRYNCGWNLGSCSCSSSCQYHGTCCNDYYDHCHYYTTENPTAILTSNTPATTAPPSCRYNCGWNLGSCSCSSSCQYHGTCCNDYYDHCHYYTTENPTAVSTSNTPATSAPPSCRYNCGRHLGSCSCSSSCRYYGNCCNDYHTYCYYYTTVWPSTAPPSCRYNCGRHLGSCSCSSSCQYYGNCCNDYYSYCYHPTTNPSTDTTSAIPCGGSLYGNGNFSSPNYPNHYPDHSYCIWNLRTSNDQRIFLKFTSLQLENCCSCDYIAVYDGPSVNSQYLGKVCQGNLTFFSSSSKYMTVLFWTDYSITARGFSAEFLSTLSPSSAPPSCRYNCGWNLGSCSCSSSCQYHGTCCNDYYAYCHNYTTETPMTSAPPSCRYNCGWNLGSCSCSSSCRYYGNCCNDYYAYCHDYTTETSMTSAPPSCRYNCGWNLGSCSCSSSCRYYGTCCPDYYSYCQSTTSRPPTAIPCGGSLYGNGNFSSPNYPYHYPDHSYCIWYLRTSNDQRILLTFTYLQLENCCSCDYIAVYDGPSVGSRYLGKVCNGSLTPFSSSSNYMTVLFRTDSSIVAKGFSAEFLSTLSPSSGRVTCSSDKMVIVIERAYLNSLGYEYNSLYLNYPNCRPGVSSSQVVFSFPIDSCGNVKKLENGRVSYTNTLRAYTSNYGEITRQSHLKLNVSCVMEQDSVSHIMYLVHHRGNSSIIGSGSFNSTMAFYTSSSFTYKVTQVPYEVTLNQDLYVQVDLRGDTEGLVIFIDTCVTSPSPDNFTARAYYLIRDGCKQDYTYNTLLNGTRDYARFSFKAFQFLRAKESVYIQCKVLICPVTDKSRCSRSCRKRKARDLGSEHDSQTLVLGPIQLKDPVNKEEEDEQKKI